jgi:hypothetical protein
VRGGRGSRAGCTSGVCCVCKQRCTSYLQATTSTLLHA